MKIYYSKDRRIYPGSHPAVVLQDDTWDDFGFKTTFSATLWMDRELRLDLQHVKIMRYGMTPGRTFLEPIYDDGLPDDYASLGADIEHYERLSRLPDLGGQVLEALRDVATDPARYDRFQAQNAFDMSLTRLAPAKDALKRLRMASGQLTDLKDPAAQSSPPAAPGPPDPMRATGARGSANTALENIRTETSQERSSENEPALKLTFTPVSSPQKQLSPSTISFDFEGPKELPHNLIAVIGPNGTGKTTLLADLALALFFGSQPGTGEDARGETEYQSGSVRQVIFISYSAYDSFEIPQQQEIATDAESELAGQGYIYIGLRNLAAEDQNVARQDRKHTLKSVSEMEQEFAQTLSRLEAAVPEAGSGARAVDRRKLFARAVKDLLKDPSLETIAPVPKTANTKGLIRSVSRLFPKLSTGHKAIMNIVASLCLHLKWDSLVLMDEPEAHLHPPLIASLLKVVRDLLDPFHSHAIVATHSPVVVQETLGRHVLVLHRIDNRTNWQPSIRETFGENLATLTRESLGLPAERADYIGRLKEVIKKDTQLEDIEKLFGTRGMSSPARAQTLRIISAVQSGQKV